MRAINGADLAPLPQESTYAVLARLADLNVWTRAGVVRAFSIGGKGTRDFQFMDCGLRPQDRLNELAGWCWKPAELGVEDQLPNLHRIMWSPALRYCPVCMASGFHCIWFQFVAMHACPLHGCLLTDRCQHCDAPVGEYRFCARLFNKPFRCSHCGEFFCGEQFRCGDEDDVRWHGALVERAFSPVYAWFNDSIRKLPFLDAIASRWASDIPVLQRLQEQIVAGAMENCHPLPSGLKWDIAVPVDMLAWRQQSVGPLRYFGDMPSRYGYLCYGRPLQVYRAVLRTLSRFVCSHEGFLGAVGPRGDSPSETGTRRLGNLQLAHLLLRRAFERSAGYAGGPDFHGVVLYEDAFTTALVGDVLERLACRAVLLSAFSVLVGLAPRLSASGELDKALPRLPVSSLPAFIGVPVGRWHHCVAILPRIDDLLDWCAYADLGGTEIVRAINQTLESSEVRAMPD